jgi:hypothetical protein
MKPNIGRPARSRPYVALLKALSSPNQAASSLASAVQPTEESSAT